MTDTSDIWASTAIAASGVTPVSAAGKATDLRQQVMAMTQAAEDAVLRPDDPGAWSHGVRAALACRIARLNASEALAARYAAGIDPDKAGFADPAEDGAGTQLAPVLRFMDRVATDPRHVSHIDISDLQAAGIADADIVRLTELNAFLAYQVRLVSGLNLLGEASQ